LKRSRASTATVHRESVSLDNHKFVTLSTWIAWPLSRFDERPPEISPVDEPYRQEADMHATRSGQSPVRSVLRRFLSAIARVLIVVGVASSDLSAFAEKKAAREVDVNWPPPARQPEPVQHVEYTEKHPARIAPAPARAPVVRAPVPLRQEGKLLIGHATTTVDGIRVELDMTRIDEPPADAEPDPGAPDEAWQMIQIESGTFDRVFFLGSGIKPIDKLEERLDQEIKIVESICPLELDQRRKLRLAARKDMQLVLEQIENLRPEFDQTWSVPASRSREALQEALALTQKAAAVRRLLNTGPFDADSLFAKYLQRIVTKEEFARITQKRDQAGLSRNARLVRPAIRAR